MTVGGSSALQPPQDLMDAIAPTVCTPLGAKTAGAAWDADSGELAIADDAELLHVHTTEDVYLLVNSSTDDPTVNGAVYAADQTHVVPCRGCTRLHYKRAGASDATISVSAFGN